MLARWSARRWGLLVLVGVTLVWGTTFPVMKELGQHFGALEIILLRFAIASVVLAPLLRDLSWAELRWGAAIGSVMFCAFYLQVSGLAQTSSNRNAFVTGLNVLIVPLLAYCLGQRLGWTLLLGAVLGVLGLTGLFYEQAPWSHGDTLTMIGAFIYAVYVLMFEYSARAKPALRAERIALVQSGVVLLLATLGYSAADPTPWNDLWARSQDYIGVLLYLGVLASAGMIWLQTWAQHRVRAVEAAIIYGMEPVFAAVAAFWWINETLSTRALFGGALIVLGVVIAQIKPAAAPA